MSDEQGRRQVWQRLRRDRAAVVSAAALCLVVLFALGAPVIAWLTGHGPDEPFDRTGLTPTGLPVPPNREFWFGTDGLGRDVVVRVAYGARVSLVVGVLATALAVAGGVVVGLVAGYLGGPVSAFLTRLMDVVLSFPALLAAVALASVLGPSPAVTVGVIAFFSWARIGRLIRGQTLSVKEQGFIEAARSLGAGRVRILSVHILPHLTGPITVSAALLVPTAIMVEASLSFLGLGVRPPTPTIGGMLSEAVQYYRVAWWLILAPGTVLLATTVALNRLGDSLRDAIDPAERGDSRAADRGFRAAARRNAGMS